MNALRAGWRLCRVLAHALRGWNTVVFRFPAMGQPQREASVQAWAQRMLEELGVGLEVRGITPTAGPMMLVANHISWLDIVVLHAAHHCRFVSKSDVAHWPLIGRLAPAAGTMYIERESRRDALRVVHHMTEGLLEGDILAIFPEGTTSDGISMLPFHANLIQAAVSAHAPVQPVALRFTDAATGANSLTPCYIGDDSLVGSLWRTVSGPRITAVVSYGEPEYCKGRDRRAWARDLRASVQALRQA
jgi:1-acyl-sn-glycerol-3-phosphate acyltransferase